MVVTYKNNFWFEFNAVVYIMSCLVLYKVALSVI